MDLISSNIGNGDGEIPSSNPIYTDFDQKRQTSDHGESIHIQILPGVLKAWGGGGVLPLPFMGYIGLCCCEGYGFQAVYSRIGYINQNVWV